MLKEQKIDKRHLRGFGSLSLERMKVIGHLGGTRANLLGKAHKWTSEEARRAGRLGGKKRAEKRNIILKGGE